MRFDLRVAVWPALAASLVGAGIYSATAQTASSRFTNPARFAAPTGEELYADICAGCHMPNGAGATGAGTYPALASNPKLATAAYPVTLIINGQKGMPPFGGLLTDQQVAAVVNYVRSHFGNRFTDEVTADDAKAARP
jgi:mono/diheme cytochrome c family protein